MIRNLRRCCAISAWRLLHAERSLERDVNIVWPLVCGLDWWFGDLNPRWSCLPMLDLISQSDMLANIGMSEN